MARSQAQENAMLLDPNRERIAKDMAVLPGGPENNNPMNVTDDNPTPIQGDSIYGDYRQNYAQMGTGMINPMNVGPSGLMQFTPAGQGQNMTPYGLQQQPDTRANSPFTDMMESSRISEQVSLNGLPANAMGFAGAGPIMGAMDPQMPGSTGPMLMPGSQSAEEMAANGSPPLMMGTPNAESMVPGSTPQKIGRKKRGNR